MLALVASGSIALIAFAVAVCNPGVLYFGHCGGLGPAQAPPAAGAALPGARHCGGRAGEHCRLPVFDRAAGTGGGVGRPCLVRAGARHLLFFYGRRHFAAAQMELAAAAPGPKERERMDREYRRWKWAVTLGAAAVPLLFLAGFLRR